MRLCMYEKIVYSILIGGKSVSAFQENIIMKTLFSPVNVTTILLAIHALKLSLRKVQLEIDLHSIILSHIFKRRKWEHGVAERFSKLEFRTFAFYFCFKI